MESASAPARVLVVAHKTAATPALLDAVRERAARGPTRFTLLVPNTAHGLHKVMDPEDQESSEADHVLELAIPLLEEAAGAPVEGMVGDPSPMDAIADAINVHGFDEVIISTLPARVSKWMRLDLPSKVAGLGLPVTTMTAAGRSAAPSVAKASSSQGISSGANALTSVASDVVRGVPWSVASKTITTTPFSAFE